MNDETPIRVVAKTCLEIYESDEFTEALLIKRLAKEVLTTTEASNPPVYAPALYPGMAEIVKGHGYALSVHGSLQRDFDLIAVPWTAAPSTPEHVVKNLVGQLAMEQVGEAEDKGHGRKAFTLSVGFGECFVDLSFMQPHTHGPE